MRVIMEDEVKRIAELEENVKRLTNAVQNVVHDDDMFGEVSQSTIRECREALAKE